MLVYFHHVTDCITFTRKTILACADKRSKIAACLGWQIADEPTTSLAEQISEDSEWTFEPDLEQVVGVESTSEKRDETCDCWQTDFDNDCGGRDDRDDDDDSDDY